jgi:hypothetical protein
MSVCSVDIGTMNLVAARQGEAGVETTRMRDAFLDLPQSAKKVLKLSGADYIEADDEILLLGDQAMELAALFGREARRPLSAGLVSAGEMQGLDVLGFMLKSILGPPRTPNEVCYYSIPAAPIDNPDKDIIYHKRVFERILTEQGYNAFPSNEAMAIVFSECASDGFSALSFSFGSGMSNVALGYGAVEAMSFSVERGGDWIDQGAAKAVGGTATRMCSIKEAGIDLTAPKSREEEAIVFYYRELVDHALDWTSKEFRKRGLAQTITKPVPIVVSGGTSTAIGFLDLFREVLAKKKMPLQIKEVRAASNPFDAVARGLLIQALQED